MKLNYKRTILVGFAFFLISAFWQAYDTIIPLVLTNHYGLPQDLSGVIMSADNVLAVFMLPVFGALSDKINSRYGKRTPFIVIGTVLAIIFFGILFVVNSQQLNAVLSSDIPALRAAADAKLELADANGDAAMREAAMAELARVQEMTLELTRSSIGTVIAFVVLLLCTLIAMATFRSPAVALMPDVTVKPLRSKGNAIINLMGAAGGIIVLAFGMIFKTSGRPYMDLSAYIFAICALMAIALAVFIFTVKEKKWAASMEEDTKRFGIEEKASEDAPTEKRKLSRPEFISLSLILASVALWYIGYNSITSKYSVYASNVLHFDYNATLIIAQAAAIVSYIPVGMLASKIGRRRSILIGVAMLASAFLSATFISSSSSPVFMYVVFILAGIGWATINVNSFPMVVELASGGDVGKYTGYYYTASMSAQIITPILSGFLVERVFGWGIFFPYAAFFVACSFVTMYFVKYGDAKPESQSALEALAGADD